VINGVMGGCAGTNYGENNSLMAITRCYSAPVIMVAGIIAVALGFVGKLAVMIHSISALSFDVPASL
jgi:uracil permease